MRTSLIVDASVRQLSPVRSEDNPIPRSLATCPLFQEAFRCLAGGAPWGLVDGEVIGYEPPWLVAYRIFLAQPRVLRITCSASDGATRVHVYQSDDAAPLTIDLSLLHADPAPEPTPP